MVAAALLAVLVAGPVPAWPQPEELDEATRAQEQAETAQEDGLRRLAELEAEIAAGQEELIRLGAEMEAIRRDEQRAREAIPQLQAASEAARRRVAEGEGRVREVEALLESRNDELAAWAVEMFKNGRGSSMRSGLFNDLVGDGSGDFMQRLPYLEALAHADAERMEQVASGAAVVQAAHAEVERARDLAVAQEAEAVAMVENAESLVAQQEQLIDESLAQQQRRAQALAQLETDNAAQAALVLRLGMQTATLNQRLAVQQGAGTPAWAAALPEAGRRWVPAMLSAAVDEGIDARLLAAVAWTESNFRPDAVSPVGALGLTQLMPGTAAGLGVDPRVPEQNLQGGARYLRQMLDRYPDHPEYALAAYNAGPGRVDDAGGIPDITETQLYVTRVLERYDTLATAG